jgi:hypothetical protein
MANPLYLKKKGDPGHIYHAYTDLLFARGDMKAFNPGAAEVVTDSPAPPVAEVGKPCRAMSNGFGYWKVVKGDDKELVANNMSKKEAVAMAASLNEG